MLKHTIALAIMLVLAVLCAWLAFGESPAPCPPPMPEAAEVARLGAAAELCSQGVESGCRYIGEDVAALLRP